jgi:LysM repeat protein
MGIVIDKRPKVELTLEEIATKFGVDVNQLKIKK